MPGCVVKLCKNNTTKNKKNTGITYHQFPADPVICERWTAILRLSREESWWKPGKRSVICCAHFNESDLYFTKGGLKRLYKEAVPKVGLFLSSTLPDYFFDKSTVTAETNTSISVVQGTTVTTDEDPHGDKEGVVQDTDILCKNCQNVIVGFRYKCITCEDYNLCKKCEMMETHSEHYVLRIPKPFDSKEAEEIVQKLQQIFETEEGILPVDMEDEECEDDEPIQEDNVDEDIHSTEQLKNVTNNEASRVVDKTKDVRESNVTVPRKRKRTTAERETVGDGKRLFDANAKVNAARDKATGDVNSDSDSDNSFIEIEIKEEICDDEESEMVSGQDEDETVNPYNYEGENQL